MLRFSKQGWRITGCTTAAHCLFADESFEKNRFRQYRLFLGRRALHAGRTLPRAENRRAAVPEFLRKRLYGQNCRFAAHGFTLYDAADIRALAKNLPLRCILEQRSRDWAVSKSGKLVRREFVDLAFERV